MKLPHEVREGKRVKTFFCLVFASFISFNHLFLEFSLNKDSKTVSNRAKKYRTFFAGFSLK